MRTTSLKTIYLTIPELEEAVTRYIRDKQGKEGLYAHLMSNEWTMDWASEGKEFAISMDGEFKDKTSEQDIDQKQWVVNVEHVDECATENLAVRKVGELCIRFPDELMEQLGWEIGDEIEWGETDIHDDRDEHKGFTLSNLTRNPKVEPNET